MYLQTYKVCAIIYGDKNKKKTKQQEKAVQIFRLFFVKKKNYYTT